MSDLTINWLYILCASVGITGIIQWAKALLKNPKNVWSYFSPFLSFCGAVLLSNLDITHWKQVVMNTLLVLATSQLGYNLLMQPIKKLLGIPEVVATTNTPVIPEKIIPHTETGSQGFSLPLSEAKENKEPPVV
jgi:hypothetical protein